MADLRDKSWSVLIALASSKRNFYQYEFIFVASVIASRLWEYLAREAK